MSRPVPSLRRKATICSQLWTGALLFLFLGWTSPAMAEGAQTKPAKQQAAKELFSEGVELLEAEAYEDALRVFKTAYELAPHHSVLYNIARVYEKLGEREKAIEAYHSYLETAKDEASPQRVEAVKSRLVTLEGEEQEPAEAVGQLHIEVSPAHALIVVDGERLAPGVTSVALSSGTHVVTASAPEHQARTVSVEVSGGESSTVQLALPAQAPPPAPPRVAEVEATPVVVEETPAAVEEEPKGLSTQKKVGLTMGAVGLAAAATTVGIVVWNENRHSTWQTEQQRIAGLPLDTPDLAALRAASDQELKSIKTVDTVSWVLGVTGGVLLVAGSVTYFVDFSSSNHHVQVGPSRVGYTLHF